MSEVTKTAFLFDLDEKVLERSGAYRVYNDPADLLRHLDEVGSGERSRSE